ncbi:MAG: A24 family peptidase [Pseudomonadota bacterium]
MTLLIGIQRPLLLPHLGLYGLVALPVLVEMPVEIRLLSLALGAILIWISCVDLKRFVIPDKASASLALTGVAATLIHAPELMLQHLGAGVLAGGLFWALAECFRALRGYDGLGLGDAKLIAGSALWLGLWALPAVIFIAAISGLTITLFYRATMGVAKTDRIGIALGPFLAFATWLTWLYGPLI